MDRGLRAGPRRRRREAAEPAVPPRRAGMGEGEEPRLLALRTRTRGCVPCPKARPFDAMAKAFCEGGRGGCFPRSYCSHSGCEEEVRTRSATGLVLHLRHLLGAGAEAAHPWGDQRRLPSIREALFARRQSRDRGIFASGQEDRRKGLSHASTTGRRTREEGGKDREAHRSRCYGDPENRPRPLTPWGCT